MRTLTREEAPLRGRAGLDLVMQPMEFRHAADRLASGAPLDLAAAVYSVIGGVIGYDPWLECSPQDASRRPRPGVTATAASANSHPWLNIRSDISSLP